MGCCSESAKNRVAFMVMGAANTMVYTTMLAAAFDLLSRSQEVDNQVTNQLNATSLAQQQQQQPRPYCNKQSTSTILLANTLPSLTIKIFYPFLLVQVRSSHKTIVVAMLSASAFLITGLFMSQLVVFIGVICASLAFGMGESNLLSISYLYGDSAMSGWYQGTGLAAFFGSLAYAVLRMVLSVKYIMIVLLVAPLSLLVAYFSLKLPTETTNTSSGNCLSIIGDERKSSSDLGLAKASAKSEDDSPETSSFRTKLRHLASLSKYFFPLLLVYFAEYLINQGLFELIYYPEIEQLDHAAQYRWFVVSYQLGVMISRSSLEVIKINNIWAMSLLQFVNAILFYVHAAKLIHLPSFYLVLVLIIYEGLLGGFTYVNAFYRIRQEAPPAWREFSISAATVADALGIVAAGFVALPMHNALCQLYI